MDINKVNKAKNELFGTKTESGEYVETQTTGDIPKTEAVTNFDAAITALLPTVIGAIFGGSEGLGIGLDAGGKAIMQLQDEKRKEEQTNLEIGKMRQSERRIKNEQIQTAVNLVNAEEQRDFQADQSQLDRDARRQDAQLANQLADRNFKNKTEQELFKDLGKEVSVQNFEKGKTQVGLVKSLLALNTRIADVLAITTMAKIADPDSAVRQEEYLNFESAVNSWFTEHKHLDDSVISAKLNEFLNANGMWNSVKALASGVSPALEGTISKLSGSGGISKEGRINVLNAAEAALEGKVLGLGDTLKKYEGMFNLIGEPGKERVAGHFYSELKDFNDRASKRQEEKQKEADREKDEEAIKESRVKNLKDKNVNAREFLEIDKPKKPINLQNFTMDSLSKRNQL